LDNFTRKFWSFAVRRKQCYLFALHLTVPENIDCLAPLCFLIVIYLTEVQHLTLDNLVAHCPVALNNAPAAMFFAVLEMVFCPKKHDRGFMEKHRQVKGIDRHFKQFWHP
jgi:hypothetical protein